MSEQTFTVDDVTYTSLPACSVGDYGGHGTIGRANIDSIRADYFCVDVGYDALSTYDDSWRDREFDMIREEDYPILVCVSGDYGYEELFMREDAPDFEELTKCLNDYAVYDEHAWSIQEQEDKQANWESCWMESDFLDLIRDTAFDGWEDERYDTWEATYRELDFGLHQVESWLNNEFNLYIEEDGYQSYRMDFDRLKKTILEYKDPVELMNEFLKEYS